MSCQRRSLPSLSSLLTLRTQCGQTAKLRGFVNTTNTHHKNAGAAKITRNVAKIFQCLCIFSGSPVCFLQRENGDGNYGCAIGAVANFILWGGANVIFCSLRDNDTKIVLNKPQKKMNNLNFGPISHFLICSRKPKWWFSWDSGWYLGPFYYFLILKVDEKWTKYIISLSFQISLACHIICVVRWPTPGIFQRDQEIKCT